MLDMLEKLYNDKIILDHGIEVGKELANVLSCLLYTSDAADE